jgi:UDPglucose 6-dehydrogenase
MRIGVFGAGYVGLVTAVCLAEVGHLLQVVEVDGDKVVKLNQGISTIYEPGLDELLERNVSRGSIWFTDDARTVVDHSEVIFLCVGTPPKPDGSADLSQIESAVRKIADSAKEDEYKLVVVKSTVPVGTAERLGRLVREEAGGRPITIEIASNPEFLRAGSAVRDFMNPDRIVVGADSEKARSMLRSVYESFDCPKMFTTPETSEIIKYAANSFLAMKISFINMIADLCEEVGADVTLVAEGMGYDKRIGSDFLRAGIGFGGSCFPKDIRAFLHVAKSRGIDFGLLEEVMRINNRRTARIVERLRTHLDGLDKKRIAVLGLSFKPGTDDVRESQAAKLIRLLLREGAIVKATDPLGIANFKREYPDLVEEVEFHEQAETAIAGSHAAIVVTDWKEYKTLDWTRIWNEMSRPVIFDTRNLLNPDDMLDLHYEYLAIGKEFMHLTAKTLT